MCPIATAFQISTATVVGRGSVDVNVDVEGVLLPEKRIMIWRLLSYYGTLLCS